MKSDPARTPATPKIEVEIAGIAACAAAFVVQRFTNAADPGTGSVVAMALVVVGLTAIGVAVAATPKRFVAILLAAVGAGFAAEAVHPAWDSIRLLIWVMAVVAAIAAVILLLPAGLQKAIISLLAVYHFCGVITAITSPSPSPWLSQVLWVHVFRPHLVFTYVNNAYQFYSPEPGPASLLWFCVEFDDGELEWFKMPRKPETRLDPMAQQFFRRLSLTEFANQNMTMPFVPQSTLQERYKAVDRVPLHPGMSELAQYRLPQDLTLRTIASYARHIVAEYGRDRVKGVKIYRVLHAMLTREQFAEGEDPFDKSTYYPYFLGEFDRAGELKDPEDPLLYWLIPIVARAGGFADRPGKSRDVDNHLTRHAGLDPFTDIPESGGK